LSNFKNTEYAEIDIEKISIPVGLFDRPVEEYTSDQTLFSLAGSIEKNTLAQPIVVKRVGEDGNFEVVAGKRRLGAWRILQKKFRESGDSVYDKIPVIIISTTTSDGLSIAIDENLERKAVSEVGYMNLVYATICTNAECLIPADGEDDITRKGLAILMYYYYKNSFGKAEKKYLMKLPCDGGIAIKATDAFLERSRTSIGNIIRKAKLAEMPSDFLYAIDLKWVLQKDIYSFYKANKGKEEEISALDLKIKELKRKKTDVSSAVEQLSVFILGKEIHSKQSVLLPKREYNKIKKQQDAILQRLSLFDKAHPKLKIIKDHYDAIESILNKE
jgi:hypothetical protein